MRFGGLEGRLSSGANARGGLGNLDLGSYAGFFPLSVSSVSRDAFGILAIAVIVLDGRVLNGATARMLCRRRKEVRRELVGVVKVDKFWTGNGLHF